MELSSAVDAFSSNADNVIIDDLVIEKFAPFSQHGAIEINGSGWVIEDTEIRFNHSAGIKVNCCSDVVIENNKIHSNGQLGIGAFSTANLLVDGNELAYNNSDGFWVNDGENGGFKATRSSATVQNNYVHDNLGLGLWFDIDVKGATIQNNYLSNNASDGLRFEVSYDAIIRNNTIIGNGFDRQHGDRQLWYGSGLNISNSSNVHIYKNMVIKNNNGIGLTSRGRGGGAYGEHLLSNVTVRDNVITQLEGATGLIDDLGDDTVYETNRFRNNLYHLDAADSLRFYWMHGAIAIDEWMGYGQDVGGAASYDATIPVDPQPPRLIVGPSGN
jgi:polygalacturonase